MRISVPFGHLFRNHSDTHFGSIRTLVSESSGHPFRTFGHSFRGCRTPQRKAIHIICDNLSAHKTKAVKAWLAAHPHVTIHYTPTYSSWLNQIELWFAKIERDVLARGIFSSVPDLRRKLMQYIRAHNKTCRPFIWTYRNVRRRIRVNGK